MSRLDVTEMRQAMNERVAARFLEAGVQEDFVSKMTRLFENFTAKGAAEAASWFKGTFRFDVSKTPPGGKALKALASKFHWFLNAAAGFRPEETSNEDAWTRGGKEAARIWEQEVRPVAGELARLFTNEGGKVVPKEVSVGSNTYVNLVGFDEKTLQGYAKALEKVFDEVKGWRRKALAGGVKVVLAGPKEFRGTSSGVYRSAEDALYVKATPAVLKRTNGTYASADYILIHELGHRYERKNPTGGVDWDRPEWWTSVYSRKEGESFAELFAISNFGLKGTWNQANVEKFDEVMG